MTYDERGFMAFKPHDQCYGKIHGIVCWNDLILCASMHIGMANKVSEGSFHFRFTKKSFPIFRVPKLGFFVKDLTNLGCKIVPCQFSKILYHISCAINQLVVCKKLFNHLSSKWQISADSAGTGSILNYKCFIVFSLFFVNFSFRYKSSHFIKVIPKVLLRWHRHTSFAPINK